LQARCDVIRSCGQSSGESITPLEATRESSIRPESARIATVFVLKVHRSTIESDEIFGRLVAWYSRCGRAAGRLSPNGCRQTGTGNPSNKMQHSGTGVLLPQIVPAQRQQALTHPTSLSNIEQGDDNPALESRCVAAAAIVRGICGPGGRCKSGTPPR
jgi:hypothetical protein